MLDAIETALLFILPWSFVAKTSTLAVLWWTLYRHTVPTGPLGKAINTEFRDQMIQAAFNTLVMFIVSAQIDATEIDFPFVSIALTGVALWPWRTAYSHFRVWRIYWRMARDKEARAGS